MVVNLNWDLDSIFPGGSDSATLSQFLEDLTRDLDHYDVTTLPQLEEECFSVWVEVFNKLYDLGARLQQAGSFITCLASQNVRDEKARLLHSNIDQMGAKLGVFWTQVTAAAAEQPDALWKQFLAETELNGVAFQLDEERTKAKDRMAPEMETLVNNLAPSGYHAWGRLYELMSGDKQVTFDAEKISLGQLQSKFMDAPNRDVRQRAFKLFVESWEELASLYASMLNNQAGFRLALYQQRGWDSVLKEPLINNRLTQTTLDVMWDVIEVKSVKLLDYFAAKAHLFGIDKLSWFDLWAPVGQVNDKFSFSAAADFVVDNIKQLNPEIAEFCRMAVENRWVEAEDRPYKRAGAYCTRLPLSRQPRVFMTYNGSFNGMLTLAHELGHAYHGWIMRDLPFGAQRYTMSVAETASTMNELIVKDASIRAAQNDQTRLSILGTKLNNASLFLMNIRARYDFERAFFKAKARNEVSVETLSYLMLDAQKIAYKDSLDQYHPLFWASKLHFYITHSPFYNFPYTFGYLFSNGVYAWAMAEPETFQKQYRALLRDTGSMGTEALAQKHLGIDLTKPNFWETAVDRILTDVDDFIALSSKEAGDMGHRSPPSVKILDAD